jgi:uncharacterized membrane protein
MPIERQKAGLLMLWQNGDFMGKKIIQYILMLIAIPAVILLGTLVFKEKQLAFLSLVVAILSCVPFFMSFERNNQSIHKLVIIAVMVAMSVAGRFIFAPIPHFKPVTAIVVITAMYFGSEAGFLTGALSAVISNFYFGQGPWTPFQMFTWGLLGLLAGLLAKQLKASKLLLAVYGVFAGVAFSLIMDAWMVLWYQEGFPIQIYLASIVSASYVTVIYAVSNVIFLLFLSEPMGKKLSRIKIKYGL